MAPLQGSLDTERLVGLVNDAWKPCYLNTAGPRTSSPEILQDSQRPGNHCGSFFKTITWNPWSRWHKGGGITTINGEERFSCQTPRWPCRSFWQSHTMCPDNLGHLPSHQDTSPRPYSALSPSSLTENSTANTSKVPETSHECTHITQEDRAVTSKRCFKEQEVDQYDVNVTRPLLSYRDDRAAQHHCPAQKIHVYAV